MKPVQRHEAQAVDAPHHRSVADSGVDHARGVAEDLGRGRARGRHHESRSGESEIAPHEFTERVGVLRLRVAIVGGQGARLRVAAAIRELGRVQSRRARAQVQADSPGSVSIARRGDFQGESVLLQAQLRKAVVAAVIVAEIGAHAKIVQALDRSDIGVDAGRVEMAGCESRALPAQGTQYRLGSRAEAVRNAESADDERLHRKAGFYSTLSSAQADARDTDFKPCAATCSSKGGSTESTTGT